MQKRSSQFITQLLQPAKRRQFQYMKFIFHYFMFMFHLSSCSKPLQKLSQLPIGLPAQSVRALCPWQVFFSRLPHPPLKNLNSLPHGIFAKYTVSARSRRSYGKLEDYHPVSPTPPHPAPGVLCTIEPALAKTCVSCYNTAEKILGEVRG